MPRSLTTHIDSPVALGARLRTSRERAGFSQRQLSFDGCTAAYISRLEAGARVPSLQMINELALRLGVSSQWLSTGVDAPFVEPVDLVDAEVALRLGDLEEAERLYRGRSQPGDPARSAALSGLGQIAFKADRLHEAIELFEESLAMSGDGMLVDPGAVDSLGRAYAGIGARESAIALFQTARDEARAAKTTIEELRFSILLANALIDSGASADAERVLAVVIRIADGLKDPIASAPVYWSQSRLHGVRGEPRLAARYARRALDILERTENTSYIGMAYHLLAYAETELGNGDQALELLGRGRALIGGELLPNQDAKFAIDEARAFVLVGRTGEAARAGHRALELVSTLTPGDRGRALATLAEVFGQVEEPDRAAALYDQSLELLVEHGKPYALDVGRRYADLLEAQGDTAGALRVLRLATGVAAVAERR